MCGKGSYSEALGVAVPPVAFSFQVLRAESYDSVNTEVVSLFVPFPLLSSECLPPLSRPLAADTFLDIMLIHTGQLILIVGFYVGISSVAPSNDVGRSP